MRSYKVFKYSRHIRYFLFFITLFLLVAVFKLYFNSLYNIQSSIDETKQESRDLKSDKYFMENFQKNYLSGKYVNYFFQHEKGMLLDGEYNVRLSKINPSNISKKQGKKIKDIEKEKNIVNVSNPKDAWMYILKEKFEKNF